MSLHENGLPCRCKTVCNFRQPWINTGCPSELMGYLVFSKKGLVYKMPLEKLQLKFVIPK